jgi:2-amino-4-hydroxy-6-hydroxymethyldihydropteridine diphosphokinase
VSVRAFVGLGSNLGDRLENLRKMVNLLDHLDRTSVVRSSRVYLTEPVGPPQPDYLNAVVELRTDLSARELLDGCLAAEAELGRVRAERWGPRTIDADVLLHADARIDQPGLVVPHPRMFERGFVLVPLLELEPDLPGLDLATWRPVVGAVEGVRPYAPPLATPRTVSA